MPEFKDWNDVITYIADITLQKESLIKRLEEKDNEIEELKAMLYENDINEYNRLAMEDE